MARPAVNRSSNSLTKHESTLPALSAIPQLDKLRTALVPVQSNAHQPDLRSTKDETTATIQQEEGWEIITPIGIGVIGAGAVLAGVAVAAQFQDLFGEPHHADNPPDAHQPPVPPAGNNNQQPPDENLDHHLDG